MSTAPAAMQSAARLLPVIEALAGYAISGVSNGRLATEVKLDAAAVTRATQTLIDYGWARKDEHTGLFHPTPAMGRVFARVLQDISSAEQKLRDQSISFTRL